jgi:Arc/MetJ family transcription regulator
MIDDHSIQRRPIVAVHSYARGVHHPKRKRLLVSTTKIDIDDEALAEAMRLMGAVTETEAVNIALREYVARTQRLQTADEKIARNRT